MESIESEKFLEGQHTHELSGQTPQEESTTQPEAPAAPEKLVEPKSPRGGELKKENEFKKNKAAASEFLDKERKGEEDIGVGFYENTGKLDSNVRELLWRLNDLPFLYTTNSCGGHIITEESLIEKYGKLPKGRKHPPEGFAVYISGGVYFIIDGSPRSLEFIEKLSEVIKGFEGAEFYKPSDDSPTGVVKFGEITGRRFIGIDRARELEAKREAFKAEIIRLAEEFL